MAPKRSSKKPKKEGPSPALSFLIEPSSPDAVGPSRPRSKVLPFKALGFQDSHLGPKTGESSKKLPGLKPQLANGRGKGKGKEHPVVSDLLWCDCYGPAEISDLAIHKKKLEQVEGWLREALDGKDTIKKYRRILVLSGPAGSGKSSLVKVLAKRNNLNFDIVEWKVEETQSGIDPEYYWDRGRPNGQQSDTLVEGINASLVDRFGLFLTSASRYSTLAMELDDDDGATSPTKPTVALDIPLTQNTTSPRRVIVLEDLPNVNHLPTRSSFNTALEAFLYQESDQSIPLILILSENIPRLDDWGAEGSGSNYKDRNEATLTIRNLIPAPIRNNPRFQQIEFNAVAPTILIKALKRTLELARPALPIKMPAASSASTKDMMDAIVDSCNGDIRSAVNTLQVFCLKGNSSFEDRGVKRKSDGKAVKKKSKMSSRKEIGFISGRESSLVLFHALGKILYNKRVGDPDDEEDSEPEEEEETKGKRKKTLHLPSHWQSMDRRESRVDVEMLWRTLPVDSSTLQAFLHENYPPFCNDVDQCAAFSDNLSMAESLKPAHEEWFHAPLTDYYSFLVSVHGSLLSLPSPITRDKVRKLKGTALYKNMKALRENREKMVDIQDAHLQGIQDEAGLFTASTLSEATVDSLLRELLPLLSKSHASDCSNAIKEMVHLPWSTRREQEEMGLSDDELDESIQEGLKGIEEGPVQARKIEGNGTKEITPIGLLAKQRSEDVDFAEGQDEEEDEEDIEEFD